jgi:mannan endo-1,4-beta-mannosidase
MNGFSAVIHIVKTGKKCIFIPQMSRNLIFQLQDHYTLFNMKTFTYTVLLTVLCLCASGQKNPLPADKKATRETIILYQSLYDLKNKGIMFGHQDDLMYGYSWWYEKNRSDTKEVTGDFPAVAGFELGHLELGAERSLDSVSFAQITEQIKIHYKRGGVVSLSWHPNNPLTMQLKDSLSKWPNGSAWDVTSKEVVSSILPGGRNNALFNTWLEKLAVFFNGLKDENGLAIPVIFRPFHEHSGSFFWWGTSLCTDKEYSSLWRYTVDFLRDKKNIHNILYAYNTDRVTSLDQYMKGYPGDDIIDMLSLDMYDRGKQFDAELDSALNFVTLEAVSRNKLTALSETGERKGMNNWWSTVILPIVSKYPVGYVLTWRDTYDPGHPNTQKPLTPYPEDFKIFYNSPRTLFLKEIQAANIYRRK